MSGTVNSSNLQISDISIELLPSSSKCIDSFDIRIDSEVVASWEHSDRNGEKAREGALTLVPPRYIYSSLDIAIHLCYKRLARNRLRDQEVSIQIGDLLTMPIDQQGDRKEWRKMYGHIWVTIGLIETPNLEFIDSIEEKSSEDNGPLRPMTLDIIQTCPSFRILVIGKTGVGKSSLINRTFGINDAIVSHRDMGPADINKEISSQDNTHFLLHDSRGFEYGDDGNVKIVQRFINDRDKMPHIKDKLHAIWLCIEVPVAGARLLEKGIKDFLMLKIEGKLGEVPVIVVFTKYDKLVDREDKLMPRDGQSEDAIPKLVEQKAYARLEEICIKPFEEKTGGKIHHITVSTLQGYERSLFKLVQFTYERVREYCEDASVISAMAQRINPGVNIQASIAIGRRKYWKRLARSINFPQTALREYLEVIHADIITIWHFDDPAHYLSDAPFKALVSNVVTSDPPVGKRKVSYANNTVVAGISMVAVLAGIVASVSPAAPIVIPIAAAFVLAKWVVDVYQQTSFILECFMIYIIDLTLIMQNVFWLQVLYNEGRPITRRLIKVAVHAYLESDLKQSLRSQIKTYMHERTMLNFGPDAILDKVEELLNSCTMDATLEMLKQKGSRSDFSAIDEPWQV